LSLFTHTIHKSLRQPEKRNKKEEKEEEGFISKPGQWQ
jgi:hypothetical protein